MIFYSNDGAQPNRCLVGKGLLRTDIFFLKKNFINTKNLNSELKWERRRSLTHRGSISDVDKVQHFLEKTRGNFPSSFEAF